MIPDYYFFVATQEHAQSRERNRCCIDQEFWNLFEIKIHEGQWRSEQMSDWLAKHSMGQVSYDSIYQHIYREKRADGTIHRHFRHRCKSYRKRDSGNERRGKLKDQGVIDQHPSAVDQRPRLGDWGMDTVIGRPGGPVLVTMVERVSRYTLMVMAASKEVIAVGGAIFSFVHPDREKVVTMTILQWQGVYSSRSRRPKR